MSTSTKYPRITVRLPSMEMRKRIEEESDRENRSMSNFIVNAVDEYIDRKREHNQPRPAHS